MEPKRELSGEEKKRLANLEKVIGKGEAAFLAAAEAAHRIEREALYRPHSDLTAYCRERWEWSKSQTSRYRIAGRVVAVLNDAKLKPPANESQARELTLLKDDGLLVETWAKLCDEGDVTAARIRERVAQVLGKESPAAATPKESQSDKSDDKAATVPSAAKRTVRPEDVRVKAIVTVRLGSDHKDVLDSSGFELQHKGNGAYELPLVGPTKSEIMALLSRWGLIESVASMSLTFA